VCWTPEHAEEHVEGATDRFTLHGKGVYPWAWGKRSYTDIREFDTRGGARHKGESETNFGGLGFVSEKKKKKKVIPSLPSE